MKLNITGASNFVNRMYEACGPYQWARELLANALEAGARRVEFGLEWQAVEKGCVYRRTVADDGRGMDADELVRFFATLGDGAKRIGGVHDNFGLGAKIAALPWNPIGVVVVSYKAGRAAMVWIRRAPGAGDYELAEFEVAGRKTCVLDPTAYHAGGIDWALATPAWARGHGTVVALLGSHQHPDTALGNPQAGETDPQGLSRYLDRRFWDLAGVEVTVAELLSAKKAQWPRVPGDSDDARRPTVRRVHGARRHLPGPYAPGAESGARGVVKLAGGRVAAEWYLAAAPRPAAAAPAGGFIAVRYRNELFHVTPSKAHYRSFGVVEGAVQQRLTVILEPQRYQADNGRWGVHPDQSRSRLNFTGGGVKGGEVPLADWGLEFAERMPEAVRAAIRQARMDDSGTAEDETYRQRLQERFGDRWATKALVEAAGGERDPVPVTLAAGHATVFNDAEPEVERTLRCRRQALRVVRSRATAGGPAAGAVRGAPVVVPRFRLAAASAFEKPWHLAAWAPNDPDGPAVALNAESPILDAVVRHHQAQYPGVHAEVVAQTVRQVFGEVAACKVAHAQTLAALVPEQELDRDYRSEPALTVALMGLMAEENLIAQRLGGKLGRTKPAAQPAEPADGTAAGPAPPVGPDIEGWAGDGLEGMVPADTFGLGDFLTPGPW